MLTDPLPTEMAVVYYNIITEFLFGCIFRKCILFFCSSDQEEMFKMMENLLVCIRHCYDELLKSKGPGSMSVIYLHQFQYHILTQALQYFHEDLHDNGMGGVASERSRTMTYVPTLTSNVQPPGTCNLDYAICIVYT